MKLLPLIATLLLPSVASTAPAAGDSATATSAVHGVGLLTPATGDSRIEGNAERLKLAIPPGDYVLDIERNRMSAPRVLQEVTGDFTAEVKVTGSYPQNTETNIRGSRAFQGAGLLLMADPKTYIRLEKAQVVITEGKTVTHHTYPSWEMRLHGKPVRIASGADGILQSDAATLRITRKGNQILGAVSEDGKTWRELDPLTVRLPETVQIGVVAGHNTTSSFEPTFEDFRLSTSKQAEQ